MRKLILPNRVSKNSILSDYGDIPIFVVIGWVILLLYRDINF